jgi:hypothetical protein
MTDSMIVLFGRYIISVIVVVIKSSKKESETSKCVVESAIRSIMDVSENTLQIN